MSPLTLDDRANASTEGRLPLHDSGTRASFVEKRVSFSRAYRPLLLRAPWGQRRADNVERRTIAPKESKPGGAYAFKLTYSSWQV
eukprot:6068760-Pleurochrysis_carterae.AAC.2